MWDIRIDITPEDYWHYVRDFVRRTYASVELGTLSLALMVLSLVMGAAVTVHQGGAGWIFEYPGLVAALSAMLGAAGPGVMSWLMNRRRILGLSPRVSHAIGERQIRIDAVGVREQTATGERLRRWEGIRRIAEDGDYIFIHLDAYEAQIIPKRSFAEPVQAGELMRQCVDWWRAHHPQGPERAAAEATTVPRRRSALAFVLLWTGLVLLIALLFLLLSGE